jgi:hypothetical protein
LAVAVARGVTSPQLGKVEGPVEVEEAETTPLVATLFLVREILVGSDLILLLIPLEPVVVALAVSVETLALTRVVPEATVRPHLSQGLL